MKKTLWLILPLFIGMMTTSCGRGTDTSSRGGNTDSLSNSSAPSSSFDTSKKIKVYTRDTTSGTREGFFEKIGFSDASKDNSALANGYIEATGNGDMIEKIKNDTYGMGYISLSSLEESSLHGLTFEGVEPNEENVLNGTYALTRNFNYVTRSYQEDDAVGQIVKAFIAYLSTKEGKTTIQAHSGIVSLSKDDPSWKDIADQYPITKQDNHLLQVNFGGSTSVENIAKALSAEFSSKCGNFVANHNHTGSGDAYAYTQGDKKNDAAKLDIGFLSREIKLSSSEPALEGTYGKICVDAIVSVVNASNPLTQITKEQLVSIYKGESKLWSDIIH